MSENEAKIGAEIVSVGDELTGGIFPDLNASRLARGLLSLGIETKRITTLPDERLALGDLLRSAAAREKILLCTGGLGPTADDLTRQAAADAVGVSLVFDAPTWKSIEADMARRGRKVSETDKVTAQFPEGATILPNGAGTAPGFSMQLGSCRAFFLPGPPNEAEAMLEAHVLPDLIARKLASGALRAKRLHLFGISESVVGEKIAAHMRRGRNPLVGTTVRKGVITIHVQARSGAEIEAIALAKRDSEEIRELFPGHVFGEDGTSLAEALIARLIAKKITIVTAESCTGGLVAKMLTDVPGASNVFRGGFVVYSNEMKMSELGVPAELLKKHGAVSAECASAMAEGAARASGADLALAITGIAGPDGGSAEKPVGLVFESLRFRGETRVEKKLYPAGDRKRIRDFAARDLLFLAWRALA